MLLGSTQINNSTSDNESLVILLIMQNRYAEAYELLFIQQAPSTTSLFNIALCLHWNGNYQEALNRLDRIQLNHSSINESRTSQDINYQKIKAQQNQTEDFLNGISEAYFRHFPRDVQDAIVRLKTDCWFRLGNFQKVIAVATPVAHKGFKDIENALKLAKASLA